MLLPKDGIGVPAPLTNACSTQYNPEHTGPEQPKSLNLRDEGDLRWALIVISRFVHLTKMKNYYNKFFISCYKNTNLPIKIAKSGRTAGSTSSLSYTVLIRVHCRSKWVQAALVQDVTLISLQYYG